VQKLNDRIFYGATIWARQTITSAIFFYKPDKWFKIWFFIVNRVNHSDTKLFPRGSNLMTYAEISEHTKATKHQIDMFMRWAKKEQMLTTQKTTRGMIVTICNYNYFQDLDNYKNGTENELRPKRNRNGNDTINKNDNNGKNEKKDTITKERVYSDDFESFWKKCNWNSKGSKSSAYDQWKKYKKEIPPILDLLNIVQCQINNKIKKDRNKEFCPEFPHVERWIKKKRWEDEIDNTFKSNNGIGRCPKCKRNNIELLENGFCKDCSK